MHDSGTGTVTAFTAPAGRIFTLDAVLSVSRKRGLCRLHDDSEARLQGETMMTTILSERIETGDVLEIARDGDVISALVLLATEEAVILDACDGTTPFVIRQQRPRRLPPLRSRGLTQHLSSSPAVGSAVMSDGDVQPAATLYDAVGGMPFFERLVDTFYAGVEHDDVLSPLYPEAPDFSGARHRLDPVPRPVLGRTDHLQRRAWSPEAADAALPVSRRTAATRPLVDAHDERRAQRRAPTRPRSHAARLLRQGRRAPSQRHRPADQQRHLSALRRSPEPRSG